MAYVLGIDIGNTSTVAAVAHHRDGRWAQPEPVALHPGPGPLPSALLLATDGTFTLGESEESERTARGVLSRVGDNVPLLLAGERYRPETLVALLAAHVVDQVHGARGGPAEMVVLSHPASWGRYRRDLLHSALWDYGLKEVTLLPRTVTVAEGYAARGFAGEVAAVYALGGDTFEAALVRRNSRDRYETVGVPRTLARLGGADFDAALAAHVRTVLVRELTAAGPGARTALCRLPAECERAKRDLTVESQTDVALSLPIGPVRVPVTRLEFEELIRPAVQTTVALLAQAVRGANLAPAQLDGVLLAGGASRVPLVAELIATAGFPVETAPDPQHTAAAGAAAAGTRILSPRPLPAGPPSPAGPPTTAEFPAAVATTSHGPMARTAGPPLGPTDDLTHGDEPPPRPPVRYPPLDLPKRARRKLVRSRGHEG
ncbi:Hsp70 family protein [Micromonospora lutea]|uniref:Molecular chaperone DnaK n=1 Tax=Micromonospora lutea TaxID=419825 RepID=A0ABQ4J280_9ACTN|nr:Hsp70 family protein [Micromonospora lutea]GIJ24141.1 molecular chaperone DnaK [Micromonospora lutea]